MKRIIAVALAVALCLCGCQSESEKQDGKKLFMAITTNNVQGVREALRNLHTQEDIMAIMNGSMYISEYLGSAVRLTGEKSWKRYGERLDTHLRRSRMKMDENVWLVLFEEYASFSLESSSEGSVGQYLNAEILYVDLKSDKVLEKIPIKTGQVIYMDKEQYATFKNGTLEFYRVTDGEKIKEHKVKEYQLRKDYNVELCYDKLFFFCEDELIDVIEIKR